MLYTNAGEPLSLLHYRDLDLLLSYLRLPRYTVSVNLLYTILFAIHG